MEEIQGIIDKIAGEPCHHCGSGEALEILSMGGVIEAPEGGEVLAFHQECYVEWMERR